MQLLTGLHPLQELGLTLARSRLQEYSHCTSTKGHDPISNVAFPPRAGKHLCAPRRLFHVSRASHVSLASYLRTASLVSSFVEHVERVSRGGGQHTKPASYKRSRTCDCAACQLPSTPSLSGQAEARGHVPGERAAARHFGVHGFFRSRRDRSASDGTPLARPEHRSAGGPEPARTIARVSARAIASFFGDDRAHARALFMPSGEREPAGTLGARAGMAEPAAEHGCPARSPMNRRSRVTICSASSTGAVAISISSSPSASTRRRADRDHDLTRGGEATRLVQPFAERSGH